MGIIMGALGGAGDYLAGAMQQRVKTLDQMDMETHRSELETQKAKALADYSAVLQDNARQASVNRIDTARTGIIGKAIDSQYAGAVPADASTWTAEQQAAVDQSKGIDTAKMQSDPEITAKAAISTGDLSARDAISLAREDRRDVRDDKRHDEAGRRMDIQQKFNEDRAKYQDKLASIAEARANRMEGRQGEQMQKAELQSTRMALSSVLKDIGTQEDKLQVRLADPMLDPAQKTILAKQMATLDADRIQTRNHLLELAGVQAPKAGAGQDDFGAGLAAFAAKKSGGQPDKPTAVQPTAQPAAPSQSFNAAGYSDTQSTIDGARRGDSKALDLLQSLISRGETTPAQRQQIAKITGNR